MRKMFNIRLVYALFVGLVIPPSSAFAYDLNNGKELHDQNCVSCHASLVGGDGSGIYTRENRKIESFPALDKQVRRCRDSLGMPWPEEQIEDVLHYLNAEFYKFKKDNG